MSRSIDKACLNRFKEAVNLCNWNLVFDASDPNLSYNVFTDKLQQCCCKATSVSLCGYLSVVECVGQLNNGK